MSNSSEKKLLSRVVRRNSTIEVWSTSNRTWLRKTYHAKYQACDEAQAYEAFEDLLANTSGIRTAKVYGFDESNNALDLEYVQGPTIAEELSATGCNILEKIQDPLLELLVLAHEKNMPLDSDPTNFILEKQSSDLVLIDPICTKMELTHFSAIVFFWGLIKSFVSRGYRLDRWLSNVRAWRLLRAAYLKKTECPPHLFSLELSQYIATVITWNIQESSQEPLLKRFLRWTILIPLWSMFRIAFRLLASIERYREKPTS